MSCEYFLYGTPLVGFSLDIKSAHKLVVIRESDRGLLGFTLDDATK